MAAVLDQLSDTYTYVVESGDPRGNRYPLVSTPIPMIVTAGLYVTFTKYAPRYFEQKTPLNIKPVIAIYNLFMVLLSVHMLKEFFMATYLGSYSMTCQPVDDSWNPVSLRMVHACWLFYVSKIIELADTVFIVVRKKGELSFLHVYHHTSVVILQWILIKYVPVGAGTFQALCNCFVHSIMYSYYFMSSFPSLKKYLWWKKYLTILQMVQFVCVMLHIFIGFYEGCEYSHALAYIALFECTVLFILFANYYVQTYLKKRRAAQQERMMRKDE